MLNVRYSTKFKRDLKSCQKRGYEMNLLVKVIEILRVPAKVPDKNYDHALSGNYADYRECHLSPDWLLIYRYNDNELYLYRTGTHADLFKK